MANANVTPFNAERFLVAVDFVSYYMKKMKPDLTAIFQDSSIGIKAKVHRKISHIAAGDDMQDLLKNLDATVSNSVRKDFEEFLNNNLTSKASLSDFSRKYYDAYVEEGVCIRNFSKYCARISAMASYFYNNDVMDAPDVAVELIISSFPKDPNLNWTYVDFAQEMSKKREDAAFNAERFLVAVDFVTYFMKKNKPHLTAIFKDSSIANKAKVHRKLAHMAVSENMKSVLQALDEAESDLVRKDFEEFFNINRTSKDSLTDFSRKYYAAFLEERISIKSFSKYCARIAAMASNFYDNLMADAPDLAVKLIVSSFPDDPNLNWTYVDFAGGSKTAVQDVTRREPAGLISSESEESSNGSASISESDSSSNDKLKESEGCFGSQSASSVTPSFTVESPTAEISELRVSNLEHTSSITEHAGGCSSLDSVPVTRSCSVSPRKRAFPEGE